MKYEKPVCIDVGKVASVLGDRCSAGASATECISGNNPDTEPFCQATGNIADGNCENSGNTAGKVCYGTGGAPGWGCISATDRNVRQRF